MIYLTKEYKFCAAHRYWNDGWTEQKNDEVFGEENFMVQIAFSKTSGLATSDKLASNFDYLLWFAKNEDKVKSRQLFQYLEDGAVDVHRRRGSANTPGSSQNPFKLPQCRSPPHRGRR